MVVSTNLFLECKSGHACKQTLDTEPPGRGEDGGQGANGGTGKEDGEGQEAMEENLR